MGYGYLNESVDAFGCNQLAGNPFVCVPNIASGVLGITEDSQWQFARLGILGEYKLLDCLKLSAEVAWLPYEQLSAQDTHWLRLGSGLFDIAGPIPENGGGTGVQIEAILSYQVSDKVTFGLGGRYWHLRPRHATSKCRLSVRPRPLTLLSTIWRLRKAPTVRAAELERLALERLPSSPQARRPRG